MIDICPHCRRAVATDELLVRTPLGWTPTACCNGEAGPLPDGTSEVIRNHPLWYVSCMNDSGHKALVTGPHASYEAAKLDTGRAMRLAEEVDPRTAFYQWGVASATEPRKCHFPAPPVVAATYTVKAEVPELVDGEGDEWLAAALGTLNREGGAK